MRGSAVIDSHFSSAKHRFNISIFDQKRSMRRNLLRELRVPNPEMDWSNTAIGKRVDALRERHELLERVMDDIAEVCQKENDALQSNVSSHEVSSNEKMPVDPEGGLEDAEPTPDGQESESLLRYSRAELLGVRDEIPIVSDAAKKHPDDLRATLAAKTPSLSLLSLLSSPGPIEAGGVAEDATDTDYGEGEGSEEGEGTTEAEALLLARHAELLEQARLNALDNASPGPIEAGGVAEDGTRDVLMAEKDVEAARMPVVEEAENEDEDEDAIIVDFEDAVPEDAGKVE